MLPHNLPQNTTSFVGRETEVADYVSLLKDSACNLLTLTGSGGVGKTRLAIEVTRQMSDGVADGVYFVPLQPVSSVDNVVNTIVAALPLQQRGEVDLKQQLLDYLHDKQMVLLLDNMEHVLDFASTMTEILSKSPHIKLLITSREPLKLREEWVRQVAGLTYPPENTQSDDKTYSAIQLFTDRVRRQTRTFNLEKEYHDVVRLCRLVDGAPLALELAATWIKVMSCAAIVDEIQQDINILSTTLHNVEERHRNMRAVFDHSWGLLTDEEQAVMRRLAIFRGGFTREAAAEITGATLPILASLVDKSMVKMDSDDRYDLLELIRQYAEERLIVSGENEAILNAFERYYADFIFQREADLKGRRQFTAMTEINTDFENVRIAWIHASDLLHQQSIMQMIEGLWVFCYLTNREQEGFTLFRYAEQLFVLEQDKDTKSLRQRLLARAAVGDDIIIDLKTALDFAESIDNTVEIAFCLARLGKAIHRKNDQKQAREWLLQSLALYRQLDDHFGASGVLFWLLTTMDGTNWEEFGEYGEEALRRSRAIGDPFGIARSLSGVAMDVGRSGRFKEAEKFWLERLEIGKQYKNSEMVGGSYTMISEKVYFMQGNMEQARFAAEEAIKAGNLSGNKGFTAHPLTMLGLIASVNEDYEQGIRLCQQGASLTWDHFTNEMAAWGIAIASCGLDDFDTAQQSLFNAYNYLRLSLGQVGMVGSLPIFATILTHQGNYVRAVELLSLAFTHPVGASGWMEKWALLDRLRVELEDKLGTAIYTEAWERGSRLNLEQTVDQLFTELSFTIDAAANKANQILTEPLTERELEIMTFLDSGLTNKEVAQRLYLSVHTIRWYLRQIYTKLDVHSRTQAVAKARDLNLIP